LNTQNKHLLLGFNSFRSFLSMLSLHIYEKDYFSVSSKAAMRQKGCLD